MVELACAGLPPLEASRLEEGAEKSYSIHTIERIGLQIGDRLFYLIGADAFAEIETWHRWRDVIAKTEFIVASRPGHAYNVPEGARAYRLDTLNLDVSSTAIREQFLRGVRPDGLADPVCNYIVSHKLYTHP